MGLIEDTILETASDICCGINYLRYEELGDSFPQSSLGTGQNHLQHVTLQLLHHHEYLGATFHILVHQILVHEAHIIS